MHLFLYKEFYIGCFNDQTFERDLKLVSSNVSMTVELCVSYCVSLEFYYAGLQYSYLNIIRFLRPSVTKFLN